jgi:hypothetical protein
VSCLSSIPLRSVIVIGDDSWKARRRGMYSWVTFWKRIRRLRRLLLRLLGRVLGGREVVVTYACTCSFRL